ncbi:MAG: hypothetical protein AB1630_12790 [bacterium]
MNTITNFILAHYIIGFLLFAILLISFLVILFIVANDLNRSKGWSLNVLSFLIAFLVIASIIISCWIFRSLQLPFVTINIFFFSIFNIIFFLFIQRFKRAYITILGLLFLNLLVIFSLEGCEIEGARHSCEDFLGGLRNTIELFAEREKYYPVEAKEVYHEDIKIKCSFTKAPYEWTKNRYKIGDSPNLMLVWDGKPHGFIFKWRNVIFVGKREVKMIPEKEFQKLLKEQQGEIKQK